LEHKLGPRLHVTALIDPARERAQAVLDNKAATFVKMAYENTRIYSSFDDYCKNMDTKQQFVETAAQSRI
jgi:hypothetical protein